MSFARAWPLVDYTPNSVVLEKSTIESGVSNTVVILSLVKSGL